MGSFNTTCFASNQTIAPREGCFILPILESHTYRPIDIKLGDKDFVRYGGANQTCYPDSFWHPFGGFIEAQYDDCGSVKLLDNATNRQRLVFFFYQLSNRAAAIPQGKNRYHDVPFEFASFLESKTPELNEMLKFLRGEPVSGKPNIESSTLMSELKAAWDYAVDAISEFRLFASDREKHPFQVQLAVIHKTAFNNLIAFVEGEKNIKGESLTQRSFFDRNIGVHLERAKECVIKLQEALKEELPDDKRKELLRLLHEGVQRSEILLDGGLSRMAELNGNAHPAEAFETVSPLSRYTSGNTTLDEFFEELKPTLNSRYVLAALELLNVHIAPMIYASQDYSNSVGNEYARFVSATRTVVDEQRKNR